MTQTSLISELGTWVYLKGYDLENFKNMLHHFDHPLPWKQSKMATKQLFKKLETTNHCMQINFLFTVSTNIILSSLLPRILWLLCFSFIVLFTFYDCKNDTNTISNRQKHFYKISPSTNHLVKVKINTYTNTRQTFKTTFTQSGALGFYN